MTNTNNPTSPLNYARVAGLTYLITIFLGIFSVNFVEAKLLIPDNNAETLNNIMTHESLFRIGVASEILMYLLVVLLAWALYIILRTVNKNLALLALLFRLAEAIVGGAVTVLSGLVPLLLLHQKELFETDMLQALVALYLDVRPASLDVVLIFIGIGGTIFCYLFYKSAYIPKILAAWGILTYLTMFFISFVSLLTPDFPESMKMLFYAPGGLFEITLGLWLLFKGINIVQWKQHTLEST